VADTIEIFQFVAIVLTSLSMGVHFGTWLTEAPLRETRSGALFTEVQQGRDRVAAKIMPILGNAAILSVAACVVLVRAIPGAFALSLIALVFIVGDMAVTHAGDVPINKQVRSWNVAEPPPEWAELRDRSRRYAMPAILPRSLWALLLLATSCFLSTGPSAGDIEKHRAIWVASAVTSYSYDYTIGLGFFNNWAGHPLRIQVSHGTAVSATFLDTGAPVPAGNGLPTIDDLFASVAHLQENHILDQIRFDAHYGYPTSYHIVGPPDASGTITAGNLVPSP
jgi:hypothetical protein